MTIDLDLPSHKGELSITHNPHKTLYLSVKEYLAGEGRGLVIDDSERAAAIGLGELWQMQWYPDTPIGFHRVAASSLAAVVKAARLIDASADA